MANKIIFIILAAGVLVVCDYAIAARYGDVPFFIPSVLNITSYEECVAAGYPVLESYPPVCRGPLSKTFVKDIGNENELKDEIILDYPRPGAAIASPVTIKGKARGTWFFEGSFPVEVVDGKGNVILRHYATAMGEWMTTEFVDFSAQLEFTVPSEASSGKLVLRQDDPSGRGMVKELNVPVLFSQEMYSGPDGQSVDGTILNVFFGTRGDHEQACDLVLPVNRLVPRTQAVARAALEELLRGPTKGESQQYITSINSGVRIQKLTIENGVAKVDFSEELEEGVGGSCRVLSIRTQIIRTLKQFPSVRDVIISINGRTEDILQP